MDVSSLEGSRKLYDDVLFSLDKFNGCTAPHAHVLQPCLFADVYVGIDMPGAGFFVTGASAVGVHC